MAQRHECNKNTNGTGWHICPACDGRIHDDGCTAKLNPKKDCCKARHDALQADGHTHGLNDSSLPMAWESGHY